MKKFITISVLTVWFYYLCMCVTVNAQVKPRNPVAPSGEWTTDLVRAFVFSQADSAMVDSVKDWSPYNSWPLCYNFTAGSWENDGVEGLRYIFTPGSNGGVSALENMQLIRTPTDTAGFKSFSDKITVAMRIQVTTSGSVTGNFSFSARTLTPIYTIKTDLMDLDGGSTNHWCANIGGESCVAWDLGSGVAFKTTLVLTYAGDSLRAYQDGSFKGATVKTGTIPDWGEGYVPYVSLVATSGTLYTAWSGKMYMFAIWKRVLTASERSQIWSDPYVMWRDTGVRRWLVQ